MTTRAAFTIATGKPIYLEMACALARSFRRWNANAGIDFQIVTDADPEQFPPDLRDVPLIRIAPGQYGSGFETKLHIDRFAPAANSLFIDADCLCVREIGSVFDAFAGHSVSAVGVQMTDGEWQGDVAARCARFGLASLPRFNGGIYYLERGERSAAVFETARELLLSYDDIGLRRLRGKENEEPLISLAMAIHGHSVVPDNGRLMNCLLDAPGGISIDVLAGRAVLRNRRERSDNWFWNGLDEMEPAIVHLNAIGVRDHPFSTEAEKLRLVYAHGWRNAAAWSVAEARYALPHLASAGFKTALRPAYRALFGARRVKKSERI